VFRSAVIGSPSLLVQLLTAKGGSSCKTALETLGSSLNGYIYSLLPVDQIFFFFFFYPAEDSSLTDVAENDVGACCPASPQK